MKYIKSREEFNNLRKINEVTYQNDLGWKDTTLGKLFGSIFRGVKNIYDAKTIDRCIGNFKGLLSSGYGKMMSKKNKGAQVTTLTLLRGFAITLSEENRKNLTSENLIKSIDSLTKKINEIVNDVEEGKEEFQAFAKPYLDSLDEIANYAKKVEEGSDVENTEEKEGDKIEGNNKTETDKVEGEGSKDTLPEADKSNEISTQAKPEEQKVVAKQESLMMMFEDFVKDGKNKDQNNQPKNEAPNYDKLLGGFRDMMGSIIDELEKSLNIAPTHQDPKMVELTKLHNQLKVKYPTAKLDLLKDAIADKTFNIDTLKYVYSKLSFLSTFKASNFTSESLLLEELSNQADNIVAFLEDMYKYHELNDKLDGNGTNEPDALVKSIDKLFTSMIKFKTTNHIDAMETDNTSDEQQGSNDDENKDDKESENNSDDKEKVNKICSNILSKPIFTVKKLDSEIDKFKKEIDSFVKDIQGYNKNIQNFVNPIEVLKIFNKAYSLYTKNGYEEMDKNIRKNYERIGNTDKALNTKLFNRWKQGVLGVLSDYQKDKRGSLMSEMLYNFINDALTSDDVLHAKEGAEAKLLKKYFPALRYNESDIQSTETDFEAEPSKKKINTKASLKGKTNEKLLTFEEMDFTTPLQPELFANKAFVLKGSITKSLPKDDKITHVYNTADHDLYCYGVGRVGDFFILKFKIDNMDFLRKYIQKAGKTFNDEIRESEKYQKRIMFGAFRSGERIYTGKGGGLNIEFFDMLDQNFRAKVVFKLNSGSLIVGKNDKLAFNLSPNYTSEGGKYDYDISDKNTVIELAKKLGIENKKEENK